MILKYLIEISLVCSYKKGFHFIVAEIDKFKSKYCIFKIFKIENNGNKINVFPFIPKEELFNGIALNTKNNW